MLRANNVKTGMGGMGAIRGVAIAGCVAGLALLGILSITYHDLLLQWQPAPPRADWRTPLAYLSGAILLACAVGLAIAKYRRTAAIAAAVWIGLWALLLHLPATINARFNLGALLGLAECTAMALGIATLVRNDKTIFRIFGLCLIVFGLSHFVYADFTANMVPAWLPERLAIAYLTGAVHAIAGLCLLFDRFARQAVTIEAAMMTSFVVLLHIPHVIATPHNRLELTMLGVATLLTSATGLVATKAR
jgi:uncharacterized membrane protein